MKVRVCHYIRTLRSGNCQGGCAFLCLECRGYNTISDFLREQHLAKEIQFPVDRKINEYSVATSGDFDRILEYKRAKH
jgi:hypothetical protein